MIIKEKLEIGRRTFVKMYSDAGFYIERDGVRYSEAIDPANILRIYTETDKLIEGDVTITETKLKSDAYDYLTGRNTAND